MEILNELEIQNFVKSFKNSNVKDLGTTLNFATKHQKLRRLHLHQIQTIQTSGSDSNTDLVKDALLEISKIECLLRELFVSEIWRRECLPVLLKTEDFKPETTLPIDMIIEHEITCLSILETCCYHTDTLVELDDHLLDLLDYCHRILNTMVSVHLNLQENDIFSVVDQVAKINLAASGKQGNKKLENLERKSSVKLLNAKSKQDIYKLSEKCLSIIFNLSNELDSCPISIINRMMNSVNLPVLLIEILSQDVFCREEKQVKNGNVERLTFANGVWSKIHDNRKVQKLRVF